MMKNGKLKHMYTVGTYNNTPAVDIIIRNAKNGLNYTKRHQ